MKMDGLIFYLSSCLCSRMVDLSKKGERKKKEVQACVLNT